MVRAMEELTTLEGLELGPQIHKSNENVCFLGKFNGVPVVVKRVIVSRVDSLQKFEDEVKLLSRPELSGAACVPLAVVRAAPHYSIVLPFMPNGSLSTIMTRCELPVELIVCFALDAARALKTVHDLGYVHRDIKSANVLVGEDWRAWLTDFGSAELKAEFHDDGGIVRRAADTSNMIQPSGGFHKKNLDGTTLGYSAPEVLRNNPSVQASDIYGLGMTIAEMLTGTPPYVGMEKEDADMHTVMDASYSEHALIVAITIDHLRPGLVSVSEREGMPMALIDLVREMWVHDMHARPTCEQVVSRLEEIARSMNINTDFGEARAALAKGICSTKIEELVDEPAEQPVQASTPKAHVVHDVPVIPIDVDDVNMELDDASEQVGRHVAANYDVLVGSFATSGKRGADKMEDRHSVSHYSLGDLKSNGVMTVCTIFDGHGGAACADFANKNLGRQIGNALATSPLASEEERHRLVTSAFVAVDLGFRNGPSADKSGCTAMATVCWQPEKKAHPEKVHFMFANAGDCRAVLCRSQDGKDTAVRLTNDHNAACPNEQARIKKQGGNVVVTRDGKHRVQGHIQVTRALGDAAMKPFGVCAEPEISEYELDVSKGDEYIIIATDGVWDTLTDQDAVACVRNTAKECGLAAKRIGSEALARGSTDNISVAVFFLRKFNQHEDVVYMSKR
uniref:Serine/threonine protein kinase n=1 Tax=Mucochytrium quahogii TaxID=96639 RepID=A0A7S2RN80_9STRA|mmetsp:Transcript_15304/g.24904  ORF Transcript_15304/g.24904 Transcript_15304/m.24904 type:complete len:679 (+) Transcript_15304:52-2088(+)